ncbi:hypothetical protein BDZ91DRAFT_751038 [Kalaharituber pfeilii]|nr:hypothetical protein BDZ91DRAFT_751038 [Kalaharituber pfeilii]
MKKKAIIVLAGGHSMAAELGRGADYHQETLTKENRKFERRFRTSTHPCGSPPPLHCSTRPANLGDLLFGPPSESICFFSTEQSMSVGSRLTALYTVIVHPAIEDKPRMLFLSQRQAQMHMLQFAALRAS